MPVICGADTIADVDFNFCDPDVRLSEIKRLFVALPTSDVFSDWFNPDTWNARLSQTSTDRNAIRSLMCIGEKPLPTKIVKTISNDRKIIAKKTHSLIITIDEVSDANHIFIKQLKSGRYLRCWYETMGGFMMGGAGGIMAMVYGDMVLKRGTSEIMEYQIEVIWDSLRTEDKIESPIFDSGSGIPPVPLSMNVILYPHITGVADGIIHPSSSGHWKFHIENDGNFINYYPLEANYPIPANRYHADTQESIFTGGGAGVGLFHCDAPTPQPLINIAWTIDYVHSAYSMVVFCPASDETVTFKDIMGNVAWITPLILLNNTTNSIDDFLIPSCDIELVYSTSTFATVRLTRSRTIASTPTIGGHMDWDFPSGILRRPDPDNLSNPNICLVDLPAGTHTLGIRVTYTSTIWLADFPQSRLYFVINVV